MRQKVTQPRKNKSKKKLIIIIAIVLALGAGIFAYYQSKKPKPAETTSKSETAQSDYSGGRERPTDVPSGGAQGGATDNNGKPPASSNDPVPTTTSPNGTITVNGITANSLLKSGDTLYGASTVTGPINFRVIDEQSGVVAQGQLNVVNGSFSGKLQFTPRAETGRLDLYTTDKMGSEINNMEIPVRFK